MNAMGPGGQDAIRTQQPWHGNGRMGTGTTWDGQAPMNAYGRQGGAGFDPGHPNQGGGQDAMGTMQQSGQAYGEAMKKDPTFAGSREEQMAAYRASGQQGDPRKQPGELRMQPGQQGQGPQYFDPSAPNYQDPSKAGIRDAMYIAGRDGPMQRPTPGNMPGQQMQDAMLRYPPGTQVPGLQRPGPQGPDYFRGQGMGMDRFNQPGYQAPQQPVQGDWFRGGGMGADRFSKFGAPAPMQTQVQGNQIRGGGYGPNTQRVNRKPVGILSKPPQN
jgi:hypothetical protein